MRLNEDKAFWPAKASNADITSLGKQALEPTSPDRWNDLEPRKQDRPWRGRASPESGWQCCANSQQARPPWAGCRPGGTNGRAESP